MNRMRPLMLLVIVALAVPTVASFLRARRYEKAAAVPDNYQTWDEYRAAAHYGIEGRSAGLWIIDDPIQSDHDSQVGMPAILDWYRGLHPAGSALPEQRYMLKSDPESVAAFPKEVERFLADTMLKHNDAIEAACERAAVLNAGVRVVRSLTANSFNIDVTVDSAVPAGTIVEEWA